MTFMIRILSYLSACILLWSCGKSESDETKTISVISLTVNGIPLTDGTVNVPLELNLQIAFSGKIIPELLESNLSINNQGNKLSDLDFSYTNASTKVSISALLDYNTTYLLTLGPVNIGEDNAVLDQGVSRSFTTKDEGIITSREPCLSAANDCLENLELASEGISGRFSLYSSYTVEPDNARWEAVKNAVITIHGQNRDGDAYFESMANSLKSLNKQANTVLLSPVFKDQNAAAGNDLYWSGTGWRQGTISGGGIAKSSVWVIEQILARLSNEDVFPSLDKVIIAGHSSGALMTQVLAALIDSEEYVEKFDLQFVVANSQYFYYPRDVRYDTGKGSFQMVTGCPGYNHWPYGYNQFPAYLGNLSQNALESNLIGNKVLYLLGSNDVTTTGTLNTSDCAAVLLGENRLRRGENMFDLLQTYFPAMHHSQKTIVNGVGHDFNGMFLSSEFKSWLTEILK